MKYKKTRDIYGTYLQGYITCSYDDLVTVFGKQHTKGDCYKTSCEWAFEFEDGTIATIYDWKQNVNYCGKKDGIHYSEVIDWNVGGNRIKAVEYINNHIDRTLNSIWIRG
jgi:hypothetical protein